MRANFSSQTPSQTAVRCPGSLACSFGISTLASQANSIVTQTVWGALAPLPASSLPLACCHRDPGLRPRGWAQSCLSRTCPILVAPSWMTRLLPQPPSFPLFYLLCLHRSSWPGSSPCPFWQHLTPVLHTLGVSLNLLCRGSPPLLGTSSLLDSPSPIVTVEGQGGARGKEAERWVLSAFPTSSPITGHPPDIVSQGLSCQQGSMQVACGDVVGKGRVSGRHFLKSKQQVLQMVWVQQWNPCIDSAPWADVAKAGNSIPDAPN